MRYTLTELFCVLLALLLGAPRTSMGATPVSKPEIGSCFESAQKLERHYSANLSQNLVIREYLPSRNINGPFTTYARVQVRTNASLKSDAWWNGIIRFDFPAPKDQMSLPYNIYGIALEVPEANYSFFYDFTNNCTNAGLSLYPGQYFDLLDIHLPRFPVGTPNSDLFIHVWGHL